MNIPILTDDSLMPFGKYRGKRMSEVPADYLLWFWNAAPLPEQGSVQLNGVTFGGSLAGEMRASRKAVRRYAEDNMTALRAEAARSRTGRNSLFNAYR